MKKFSILALIVLTLIILLWVAPFEVWAGPGTGWLEPWSFRIPITISNPAGSTLTDFQVKITLGSSFDFARAKSDASDVRLTTSDGTTEIPFWIETWNESTETAIVWVQVPSIPTSGTTVYLYYGNSRAYSASDGDATFLFFDDFESPKKAQGYWTLGSPETELVQDQVWETSAPHSLSVLKLNMGGHTYWGYYSLQGNECGGVGLAFSEDLVTWTKYPSNPLFLNGRWPRVVQIGSTFYMAYTLNYCGSSEVDLASSTDGLTWTPVKQLVPPNYLSDPRNQNPDLWLNPNDGMYYLFWYSGNDTNVFRIMSRKAASPTGLDSSVSEVMVLSSAAVLAAPDIMFAHGTYFLSTETTDDAGIWNTNVFSSTTSPTGGFTELPGNPVLANGSACMFQTIFGTTLHEYYCKLTGTTWTVEHRQAELTSKRPYFPIVDPAKWTSAGGYWPLLKDTQQDGTTGLVVQARTSSPQLLQSVFSGTDYVLEAYGKQVQGRVWGLGFRVSDPNDFYSVNLYDDLNTTQNLYTYSWISNSGNLEATTLGSAAVGTVNAGTWYKLSVRAQGSSFDIYKDDVFQIHTSDATHASGGIALYGEGSTVANFNDVLVRQFAVADPTFVLGSAQDNPHPPGEKHEHDHDHDHDRDHDHDHDNKHKGYDKDDNHSDRRDYDGRDN